MTPYIKLIQAGIIIALVIAVYAAWQWDRKQQYQAGADAKEVEMRRESADILTNINTHYSGLISDAEKRAEKHRQRAAFLENQEPKTVTEYVTKFIENPLNADCVELHGISELWNAAGDNYK